MLFGFGLRYYERDAESEDERVLQAMNCDRIYLAERYSQVPLILEEMKLALRKDDIVALRCLSCLGNGLEQVLGAITSLHVMGVGFRIDALEIAPGGPFDRALGPICEMLLRAAPHGHPRASDHARRRGRPVALTDRDKARAEHLLIERNASVLEIARLLRVSPATIYRNFPQRRPRRAAE